MNYELAKQLKDAGFPQGEYPFYVKDAFNHFKKEIVYYPNLSELIEACEGDYFELIKNYLIVTGKPCIFQLFC